MKGKVDRQAASQQGPGCGDSVFIPSEGATCKILNGATTPEVSEGHAEGSAERLDKGRDTIGRLLLLPRRGAEPGLQRCPRRWRDWVCFVDSRQDLPMNWMWGEEAEKNQG